MEESPEEADQNFLRRLDAGLFVLQLTNVVLAYVCADPDIKVRSGSLSLSLFVSLSLSLSLFLSSPI